MDFEAFVLGIIDGAANFDFNILIRGLLWGLLAIWGATVIWVFFDSQERTSNKLLIGLAIVLVLLFNIIGLIIYLMIRPKITVEEQYWADLERRYLLYETSEIGDCPTCGYFLKPGYNVCPHCAYTIRVECECGVMIENGWRYCAYCGKESNLQVASSTLPGETPYPIQPHLSEQFTRKAVQYVMKQEEKLSNSTTNQGEQQLATGDSAIENDVTDAAARLQSLDPVDFNEEATFPEDSSKDQAIESDSHAGSTDTGSDLEATDLEVGDSADLPDESELMADDDIGEQEEEPPNNTEEPLTEVQEESAVLSEVTPELSTPRKKEKGIVVRFGQAVINGTLAFGEMIDKVVRGDLTEKKRARKPRKTSKKDLPAVKASEQDSKEETEKPAPKKSSKSSEKRKKKVNRKRK